MLSIANVSAAQAENYYEKDDYYTCSLDEDGVANEALDPNAIWYGAGARTLGLTGDFDQSTFQSLLHGQAPNGESLHARKIDPDRHRAATDCTFSAPKSVSIAALIQNDARVLAAHNHAVKTALSILEDRYAQTRVRRPEGVREKVTTGNLVAAVFRHETSREQDPQLHSHCVIINTTQLTDGSWRSLSNDALVANQKLLGEIYQNELAFQLRQSGYGIEPRPNGQFELAGYSPELLDTFSTRTQQIEAYLDTWETKLVAAGGVPLHRSQQKQATLDTRRRKTTVPRQVLLDGWAHTIREQGLVLPKVPTHTLDLTQASQTYAMDAATAGIHHAAERDSVFHRAKAERFALEHALGEQRFSDLRQAIAEHPELIPVDGSLVTTQTAIDRELKTIQLMQRGRGQVNPLATSEQVDQCLIQVPSLTAGQRQAVALSATTKDRVIAWQGVAGAGKTYSLKLYAELATRNGYTVTGYAPSAQAASTLGRETGIQSDTVAGLLHTKDTDPSPANHPIWIVDEAGLLSAKAAHDLLQRADDCQARVVLVGDIRQLSAVEAGNPFKSLQAAGIETAMLSESRRQQTDVLKTAVTQISAGQIEVGIAQLDAAGMIHEVAPKERFTQLIQTYLELSPQQRQQTLILSGTNAERLELIQQLRMELQIEGSLAADGFTLKSLRPKDLTQVQAQYVRHYDIGDVIVPVRDYRRHGLKRHQQYTVTDIDLTHNQLSLSSPTGQPLTLNPVHCAKKTCYRLQTVPIAVGEQLRWTRNNRDSGIRNGQRFTIQALDAQGQAQILTTDGDVKPIDLSGHQYVDYDLVGTTYSSQGKTAERVLVAADTTLSREAFYVAVSRAKRELHLYTTSKDDLVRVAQHSRANQNASDYLPLYHVVIPDAQTSKAQAPHPRADRRDDGRRIGECLARQLAATVCGNRDIENAVGRVTRRASGLTTDAGRVNRAGERSQRDSDPTVQDLSRQLATVLANHRQRVSLTRKDRQVYDDYAAQLPLMPEQQQDRLIAHRWLQTHCGGSDPTPVQLREAARILFQGPRARQLRQQENRTAAVDYVKQQVRAVAQQRLQTHQRQRDQDLER